MMRKLAISALLIAIMASGMSYGQKKYDNAFVKYFKKTDNDQCNENAYFLSLLSCYMYPERLGYGFFDGEIDRQTPDNEFRNGYAQVFGRMFYNPIPPEPPKKPTVLKPTLKANIDPKTLANLRPLMINKAGLKISKFKLGDDEKKAAKDATNTESTYQKAYAKYEQDFAAWEKTKPTFSFVHKQEGIGKDPEAMVISTPDVVVVVFRGTDRINSVIAPIHEFGEWLETDFNAVAVTPDVSGINGKVHRGFWESLKTIRQALFEEVEEAGGRNKKIWITGHSLGGGHALLFAMFLEKAKNMRVQGVYTYGGPCASGNKAFADQVNDTFGQRFQRFEFQFDIVPSIPVDLVPGQGYTKAGIRNWYKSENEYFFNRAERSVINDPFPLLTYRILSGKPSAGCEHNPEWYVRSAYKLLDRQNSSLIGNIMSIPNAPHGRTSQGLDRYTGACKDYK